MGQTLPHGIYLPDEGERNCYNGLAANWQILDTSVGTVAEHTTALAGKAPAVHTHTKSDITDLLNSNFIPSANNSYDLGSSSYQWNNAYIKALTINGVACGDILTHNASEFVDVSSNQTVGGQKIFSHGQIGIGRDLYHFASSPYAKNTPPTAISFQYIWFIGNSASQGFTNNWYSSYIEQRVSPNGSAQGRWFVRDTSESGLGIELFVNGNDKQFRPQGNNITDLGTSTNKWKSFNGINPGALSLPDKSKAMSIDTTNFAYGSNFIFTPTVSGWLFVSASDCTRASLKTSVGEYYFNQSSAIFRDTIPVIAGERVTVLFVSTATSKPTITLFPCLGNV